MLNDDGSLAKLFVWRGNYAKFEGWDSVSMHITILNEGAELGYALAMEDDGGDAMGGKEFVSKIYSEKLDANITIYRAGGYESGDEIVEGDINAIFAYDDMLYHLTGHGLTEEEMIEFVMSLE